MTEQLTHYPLDERVLTDLLNWQPAPEIRAAIDAYRMLIEEIHAIEQQGITNASPYYRAEKYLYLVHPTAEDGSRQREYIGSNFARQTAALARVDRFHIHQDLVQRADLAAQALRRAFVLISEISYLLKGI